MNSDSLSLPTSGVHFSQHIDGMREIAAYDISTDGFHGYWDTIINGRRARVHLQSGPSENKEAFLERCRPIALSCFQALEKEASNG